MHTIKGDNDVPKDDIQLIFPHVLYIPLLYFVLFYNQHAKTYTGEVSFFFPRQEKKTINVRTAKLTPLSYVLAF
jgi:hypothetical protein